MQLIPARFIFSSSALKLSGKSRVAPCPSRSSRPDRCTFRNMAGVMILFQSCPPFYRNCWCASTKRSSNWKQFVFACNSAKMRSYISPRSRCLPERYVYHPRSRYSFSFRLFLLLFASLSLPLILPARRLIISRTTHNFTSNTSHVCFTAFFAPAKLFSCVTLAPLCTL